MWSSIPSCVSREEAAIPENPAPTTSTRHSATSRGWSCCSPGALVLVDTEAIGPTYTGVASGARVLAARTATSTDPAQVDHSSVGGPLRGPLVDTGRTQPEPRARQHREDLVSNPSLPKRARRRACGALGAVALLASAPSAGASAVNLGTSGAFAVLGGSTVTNTGPSTLSGDLGVSPGTALVGFTLPAVVNGAAHAGDAVAAQAQADETTAFGVAAGQPVGPSNVLTGTDLGNRTLQPGAYRYASSAQLTGALTLDGAGDPNAQFVFEI